MNFLMQPDKGWAIKLSEDWLAGCGGGTVVRHRDRLPPGPVAMYGITPKTFPLWLQTLMERRDFYYIDNAYFSAGHADDRYMRVTKNALQCSGYGESDCQRLMAHDVETKSWREAGEHILITCQSEWWYVQHGTTLQCWLDRVVGEIRRYSSRPIKIRLKPKLQYQAPPNTQLPGEITAGDHEAPFLEDLEDAWAVVTHTSNTAVEAILEGVPAFVLGDCAAQPFALNDLKLIEEPYRPLGSDRWNWAGVMADNQWTPVEIREGKCWRDLQARAEDG